MTQHKKKSSRGHWRHYGNPQSGTSKQLTRGQIAQRYDLSDEMMDKYLPRPLLKQKKDGRLLEKWRESAVQAALRQNKELQAALEQRDRQRMREAARRQRAQELLLQYSLPSIAARSARLQRRFVVHCGPTNSGKTYEAVESLKQAPEGLYLGPLRLLALEMFDKLNASGNPCTLLTGEERVEVPFSHITSSTIEMADFSRRYDVAVIDEAQMVGDKDRGGSWTRALLLLDAALIHVCTAPEGLEAVLKLIRLSGAPVTVQMHERLTPLLPDTSFRGSKDIRDGDAIIVFSRKSVLAMAAELERKGIQASMIYGALPPQSRREEVRRFEAGVTKVVVATDAIGMGVSLPIHRIVFAETEKFDGVQRRPLTVGEIRQVAGRAGRFGIYPEGLVSVWGREKVRGPVLAALEAATPDPQSIIIPFPGEAAADDELELIRFLEGWQQLPAPEDEQLVYQDIGEYIERYRYLGEKTAAKMSNRVLLGCLTCPADVGNTAVMEYWRKCCRSVIEGHALPGVELPEETLEDCETKYKAFDVRRQMANRTGESVNDYEEKDRLSHKINRFLKGSKSGYVRRCRRCGRPLPALGRTGLCASCAEKEKL